MSVNQSNRQFELPPSIRSVLAAVRARIRAYVWAEGLAILIAVLGCAFWLGMGVDWAFEPTAGTRKIALLIIGIIVAYVAYRYVLRRVFVRISDATAAMLLERQFPSLQDHLLTAVNVAGAPPESV